MRIDPSQSEAIRHRDGPAMILAGPGSGKTTVITHRVEHMIRADHIDPASILVITFSRAAAGQMRERFGRLVDRQRLPVTFGTFHAIFFQILKIAYGYTARQIVSGEAQARFVREFMHRLRLEYVDEADLTRAVLSEISRIKSSGTDPADNRASVCGEDFCAIYFAYEEFLHQNRYIDFDDMLVFTKELLENREDILRGWQDRFRHILVDEFQDINRIQYEIVRLLALPQNNLFIVGDDDQSIYRFRGADPEIMLNFEKDYPDAEKILLGTNYRSVPEIVGAAGRLIAHNKQRFQKDIHAAAAGGFDPVFASFENQREQNLYLIQTIQNLNDKTGIPFREMAVLYRTNAQPALLMRQLAQYNLPFVSKEYIPHLFSHWIAEDINTYLRLALGDRRRSSFLRIMNRPARFLSRESLPYEKVSVDLWKQYYKNDERIAGTLDKLEADLAVIARMRPYSAINYIRKAVGYEDYLKEFAKDRHMQKEELFDVLEEIQADAAGSDTFEAWFAHQKEAINEWEKIASEKNAPDSAVRLSTLHAAKGLEFDTVFIVDVNEDVIPDKKALTEEDLEEERRLFYVGMTRAKRRLFLLCSEKIRNKTMAPSRFLEECRHPG